ncbi:metallophosphoesterase family protein [Kytococcus sp. Marseille-QA3725]
MTSPIDRRSVLRGAGLGAAGAAATAASATSPAAASPVRGGIERARLRFGKDGSFTVVQFNDTQDTHTTDRRTTQLQEAVLEDVKPDLALINGDVVNGDMSTTTQVRQAINNVVLPMEERGIPWAITMGNHDEDSAENTGMTERRILEFVQRYRHNVNGDGARGITGTGNMVLPIRGSRGGRAKAAVWLLDSGRYAPDEIVGQDFEGYPDWDWLRFDQVEWYAHTSRQLERMNGGPVPGLVFQHIALWEHRFMWWDSVDSRTEADHARAVEKHRITGERNEDECPGPFNSGMFNAMLHRGDVRGLYVGHDHINTYEGDYFGIRLGYGPGTGFGAYGLGGAQDHRLRGARVFHLTEGSDALYTSELRLASDYGIDLTEGYQPGEPRPLPKYVRWAAGAAPPRGGSVPGQGSTPGLGNSLAREG